MNYDKENKTLVLEFDEKPSIDVRYSDAVMEKLERDARDRMVFGTLVETIFSDTISFRQPPSDLSVVSHIVEGVEKDGLKTYLKIKVLDTPTGSSLKFILDNDVSVMSRANISGKWKYGRFEITAIESIDIVPGSNNVD